MISLTPKQEKLLRFIESRQPVSPSMREMAEALGYKGWERGHGLSSISSLLDQLEYRGRIRRLRNRARAIEVLQPLTPVAPPSQAARGLWAGPLRGSRPAETRRICERRG